jgi:prepilin-type N-terminal cleavage/methylation domain-containing protein
MRSPMKNRRPHHGFTLVELLVVIGIIAVLISLLLPALGNVRRQANTTKSVSNVRQMVTASVLQMSDTKGFVQCTSEPTLVAKVDPNRQRFKYRMDTSSILPADWASALLPYMGDRSGKTFIESKDKSKVFISPNDAFQDVDNPGYSMLVNYSWNYAPNSYAINADITSLVDPINRKGYFNGGFEIGVYMGDNLGAYGTGTNAKLGAPLGAKLTRVAKTSETMLYADGGVRPPVDGAGTAVATPLPGQTVSRSANGLDYSDVLAYSTNYITSNGAAFTAEEEGLKGTLEGVARTNWLRRKIPLARNNKPTDKNPRIVVSFCDGHAESVARGDFRRVRVSPFRF